MIVTFNKVRKISSMDIIHDRVSIQNSGAYVRTIWFAPSSNQCYGWFG